MELKSGGSLGAAVRAARRAAKVSQQGLAERAGMSRVSVARLEAGSSNPTWDTVLRVTSVLGMKLDATWDPEAAPTRSSPLPKRRRVAARPVQKPRPAPAGGKDADPGQTSAQKQPSGSPARTTAAKPPKRADLGAVLTRTSKRR